MQCRPERIGFIERDNHSLERTGDTARIHRKAVFCEWGENVAVEHAPAIQQETYGSLGIEETKGIIR